MAPHLMRAQGAYKADKHARPTHAHTPTNTLPTHTHKHRKNTSIVVTGPSPKVLASEAKIVILTVITRADGL